MLCNLSLKMQVMAPVCIAHMVDSVDPMEITCIQVMEEVMLVCTEVLECMVGQCVMAEWEVHMVVVVWVLVLIIRVQIHLALLHHPLDFGCPSYEW